MKRLSWATQRTRHYESQKKRDVNFDFKAYGREVEKLNNEFSQRWDEAQIRMNNLRCVEKDQYEQFRRNEIERTTILCSPFNQEFQACMEKLKILDKRIGEICDESENRICSEFEKSKNNLKLLDDRLEQCFKRYVDIRAMEFEERMVK